MEEEIDLRPYIKAVLQRWYWIVGAVVLALVLTFLVIQLSSPTYEAKSSIAIIRSRTEVSFDPRIQTLSEGELATLNADSNSRRNALIGLVKSNAVAAQVLGNVAELLPEREQSIPFLIGLVAVESEGDLIHILVQYHEAEIAAKIANTWAQSFEQTVNELYSTSGDTNLSLITDQIETVGAVYEASQHDVEAFLRDNQIELLQREIDATKETLDAYQTARNDIQSGSIKLQSENQQLTLAAYYNDLGQVELWLIKAEALREQVRSAQNSDAEKLANTIAFISLQNEVFGGSAPVQLQVNMAEPSTGIELEAVETIINVLKLRRETTNAQIEQLYGELSITDLSNTMLDDEHPISLRIKEINEGLRTLEAQMETEEAHKLRLEQSRDLAWETYQTLLIKQAEVEIAAQTLGSEVRFASPAIPPAEPINRSILTLAVAAALSFGLIIIVLLAWEWWQNGSKENWGTSESQPGK